MRFRTNVEPTAEEVAAGFFFFFFYKECDADSRAVI